MKPEHKKYILENIRTKSVKEIAGELNLKEKKIRRFIEEHREMEKQGDSDVQHASEQKEPLAPTRKRNIFLSVVLIITLGFAVYGNSLGGEFIWDDGHLIEENEYIRKWSYVGELFSGKISTGKNSGQFKFYRPLQMVTYVADYSLWKLNVIGYHLTNILLHVSAALAIYWLINLVFKEHLLALLTGVLFVVHPVHTEAVSYIAGRADPLALLFIMVSFAFYIKSLPSKSGVMYLLMLLSYVLALFSRENSLILPVLLLLYHYSFKKELKVKEFSSITGLAAIYILLRVTFLKALLTSAPYTTTLSERLPGFFVALTNYIRILFLPFNLHMEYGGKLFRLWDLRAVGGAALLLGAIIYAFRKRKDHPLIFFAVVWFFAALLPVSNLFPINAYMAEHWLYLPSIGFFLLLAMVIQALYKAKEFRIFAVILAVSLTAFYSLLTIRQNIYWKAPLSFYERTLQHAPKSSGVYYNLGSLYHSMGKQEKAIMSYKKVIEINPGDADAYYSLGVVYDTLNRKEEAMAAYQKALEIKADHRDAQTNLGAKLNMMGRQEEAIVLYKDVIKTKGDSPEAYNNLGNAYNDIGKSEEAIASYKKAIAIKPDYADARYNLGVVYAAMNRNEEAVASYKKAIEIKADYANAYINLGNVYYAMGKREETISSYKKAIEINPGDADPHYNLGNAYSAVNRREDAIVSYKKAIEIRPDYADAYYKLGKAYNAMGNGDEAITAYQKVLKINPRYAKAYANLSVIYLQRRQYPLSIEYYDKANALGLTNSVVYEALKPYR